MVSFNYGLHSQIGIAPSTTPICCAEDQGEMGRYIRQEYTTLRQLEASLSV